MWGLSIPETLVTDTREEESTGVRYGYRPLPCHLVSEDLSHLSVRTIRTSGDESIDVLPLLLSGTEFLNTNSTQLTSRLRRRETNHRPCLIHELFTIFTTEGLHSR